MIDLSDKTTASLLSSMLLSVTEQVNKREGSLIRTALSAAAWAIEGLYIELLNVQTQSFGTTATGEYLDLKVAERGLTRHPATNAVSYLKCNLSTLTIGQQFGDSSGYTWEVTSDVLSGPDSENLYTYMITCQTSGAIATPEGELRSLSFLAGLVTAVFGDVVSSGQDQETDDSLRKRYIEGLTDIAFAGNVAAYREKMLSLEYPIGNTVATIGALQVYSTTNEQGAISVGKVKIWIVDSDYNVASQELVNSVQEAICPLVDGEPAPYGNGFAPIGAKVYIATANRTPVLRIDIRVELRSSTIEIVSDKIKSNILEYIKSEMQEWGIQITSPYEVATISIKRAFLYALSLVTGVSNVLSISIIKDNVDYGNADSVTWNTNGSWMEWIVLSDVQINVTE